MTIINFKKLKKNAQTPTCGTKYSAGYDLYSCLEEPVYIKPHTSAKIPTGLAIQIPAGYFGAIYARSGLATKQGLRPSNCVGVVDSDYRGEVMVSLYNDSGEDRIVNNGERISQLVVQEYLFAGLNEVDELTETERGTGGFGSTGIK